MHTVPKRLLTFLQPLVGLLALLVSTTTAHAWWNDAWALRRPLTVDATSLGAPSVTDSAARPVLVRLHDGNFQFLQAMENGADIRFVTEDDQTLLPYHIERYDSLLNEAFVWVKLPVLKAGAKVNFWLYYGNPAAPSVNDPKGTYDDGTRLVYHFADSGAPLDSTKNSNNASTPATPVAGALIGPGHRLLGSGPVRIPFTDSLNRAADEPYTLSAWIKPAAVAPRAVIFSWGDRDNGFELGLAAGSPYFEIYDGAASGRSPAGAPLPNDTWKHLAVVSGAGVTTLYVDGVAYASMNRGIPAMTDGALLGADAGGGGGGGLIGEIDEFHISHAARGAGWVKLAVASEAGSAESQAFLVFGAEEAAGGGGHNATLEHVMLFGDIAKNMMFDGWIAVGICIIMMIIGWVVALKKFAYLKKLEQGSEEFMRQWKQVSTDLTALDHGGDVRLIGEDADPARRRLMEQSPLYHIYHIGSDEIRHRLESKRGFHGLSNRSITAIKASLDAGLTREVHRLNSGLVSLTIGIAGGPYVGLMGTVVGVMITFAVIAKTGEVEVNSIAPGIASALLATVFGLLVAIPALFLYSFLNSRIKDAVSNMQLFIDEFITKMAEFYPTKGGDGPSSPRPSAD
jgi:biopolymer transport protein ExbB